MSDTISWTDTREMPWGAFSGLEVGRVKKLYNDPDGNPIVMMVWLPPGDLGVPIPHRHYHATVYEHAFHLGGDLPHAEWAEKNADHEVVVFREGYFLDRKPGSIHGLDALYSDAGCTIILWRNGLGNWLDEPNAAEETLEVPFEREFHGLTYDQRTINDRDGIVIDRPDARILDTRELPWRPLGDVPGARVRELAFDGAGNATARMVYFPPGDAALPGLATRAEEHESALVLDGELAVKEGDRTFLAKRGWYMDRPAGAPEGLVPAGPSEVGATVLQWRMGPDTFYVPEA
jgi:hypothetical protein